MSDPEFTLTIRRASDDSFVGSATYRLGPDSDPGEDAAIPINLEPLQLLSHSQDLHAYGRLLMDMIFPPAGRLLNLWLRVAGHPRLRLRIKLDPDPVLQSICWERLCDPLEPQGVALGQKPHIWMSRTLPSIGDGRTSGSFAGTRSALLITASPDNLPQWLSQINAAEEEHRLRAVLPPALVLHTLGGREGSPRASLGQIARMLQQGPMFVFILCHGIDDGSQVILEDEHGNLVRVPVKHLANQFYRPLENRRPLLVVLGSCMSAGTGPLPAPAATLGPLLLEAKIPAVIGMQGLVEPAFVGSFVAECLTALFRHGSIERAVAESRAALSNQDNWWRPVLYSRLPDGQLLRRRSPSLKTTSPTASQLGGKQMKQRIEAVRAQSEQMAICKALHDTLHHLFVTYDRLLDAVDRRERRAREYIKDFDYDVLNLHALLAKATFLSRFDVVALQEFIAELKQLRVTIEVGWEQLSFMLIPIGSDLRLYSFRLNELLKGFAGNLPLLLLLDDLNGLLKPGTGRDGRAASLGVAELRALYEEVDQLVLIHDRWQDVMAKISPLLVEERRYVSRSTHGRDAAAQIMHQLRRAVDPCKKLRGRFSREPLAPFELGLRDAVDEFLAGHHQIDVLLTSMAAADEIERGITDVLAVSRHCFLRVDAALRQNCERLTMQISELGANL